MSCPIKCCMCGFCVCRSLVFAVFLAIAVVLGVFQLNQPLFHIINSWYNFLPTVAWQSINFVSDAEHFILVAILLLAVLVFKRNKLVRVVGLIVAYFVVFYVLKKLVHEARPFAVLDANSFNWLMNNESAAGVEHMSFPSGHVGMAAIFVFALNRLFFCGHKLIQFLLFLFLVAVAVTRVATGWHWPLDVVASGLIAYLLVQIAFYCRDGQCTKNNCKKHG